MKNAIRIRGRDGAIREVGDGHVLQDGEAYVVEMIHMDSRRRAKIHDGNGNPAGCRPARHHQ